MRQAAAHALPGIPLVESPFFEELFAEADAETRRVADDLHRQGYAVIDFPDPDFPAKAEAIKAALHDRYDWAAWRRDGFARGQGLRVQDAWSDDADVRSLAANPELLALLARLYGRRPHPFQSLNFPVGTQQALHSDSVHFSCHPERFMCGVWVALEDISDAAGPLEYVPGSHAWPICTNDAVDASIGPSSLAAVPTAWQALVAKPGTRTERFLARRGQALIWAANLLHGGARQTDPDRTRWSQVTHYYFEGCAYYTPLFSDPFAGRITFRKPVDIATGEALPNLVGGEALPEPDIAAALARAQARRDGRAFVADDAVAKAEARLAEALAENARLRKEIAGLRASASWRFTAPLRRLRSLG